MPAPSTAMSRCPSCGVLRDDGSEHRCAPAIRDVDTMGLGDRRGAAIESIRVPTYRPGTLEETGRVTWWRVYEDGRPRLTTTNEAYARETAQLIAEGRW